jgi:hypothetical protein
MSPLKPDYTSFRESEGSEDDNSLPRFPKSIAQARTSVTISHPLASTETLEETSLSLHTYPPGPASSTSQLQSQSLSVGRSKRSSEAAPDDERVPRVRVVAQSDPNQLQRQEETQQRQHDEHRREVEQMKIQHMNGMAMVMAKLEAMEIMVSICVKEDGSGAYIS